MRRARRAVAVRQLCVGAFVSVRQTGCIRRVPPTNQMPEQVGGVERTTHIAALLKLSRCEKYMVESDTRASQESVLSVRERVKVEVGDVIRVSRAAVWAQTVTGLTVATNRYGTVV